MLAVLKREYLAGVRKKMFVIMTLGLPVFMGAVFYVPMKLMSQGLGEKRVAVIDGTGSLRAGFEKSSDDLEAMKVEYVDAKSQLDIEAYARPWLQRLSVAKPRDGKIDAVLVIPSKVLDAPDTQMKFYSQSATDIITQSRLQSMATKGLHAYRLALHGIEGAETEKILSPAHVNSVQLSRTGEQKRGGEGNFLVGILLTGLLMVPSFVYGIEIMRGIIQEKNDRVVEVIVSSMSARQFLTGKILGNALTGLTQVAVWVVLGAIATGTIAAGAALGGENILRFLRPSTFLYFILFFLLAYFTYVCIYAIAGAVCNSEKEAQQMIAPITMLMMSPWFFVAVLITNPDSSLAVGFSLAPVFGPMTMFLRTLVADPPLWHILVTVVVSIATILLFFRVTAKIFRIGILSYGKRPTIPEIVRWMKVA